MNKFLNEFEEIWVDDPLNIEIGDKIVCIKNTMPYRYEDFSDKLTIDKVYEVIDLLDKEYDDIRYHKTLIINDKNDKEWFPSKWFKLI